MGWVANLKRLVCKHEYSHQYMVNVTKLSHGYFYMGEKCECVKCGYINEHPDKSIPMIMPD